MFSKTQGSVPLLLPIFGWRFQDQSTIVFDPESPEASNSVESFPKPFKTRFQTDCQTIQRLNEARSFI